ncbi:hypothetical protein Fmac_018785 [Flemingia macrophylla]|uniref:Uncharacterized protein n=1 Tax=Flemingia macrophylla TaxID=520843 RepID=A0ABD1M606_9FABA
MCQMSSLIILDIANNTISGYIPNCLGIITALVFNNALPNTLSFSFSLSGISTLIGVDNLELVTKGQESEYGSILHFVTLLDMSSNNLSGTVPPNCKIPLGTQLQGFSEFSYIGNHDLCGTPLTKLCSQGAKSKDTKVGSESELLSWFYIGIESGFVTGFLESVLPYS